MADKKPTSSSHEMNSIVAPGPSRKLPLSKFDSQGLCARWKDASEKEEAEGRLKELTRAFETILGCLDDSRPHRDGLRKTPLRAAKALLFFTKGYEEDLPCKFYRLVLDLHDATFIS